MLGAQGLRLCVEDSLVVFVAFLSNLEDGANMLARIGPLTVVL